MYVSTLPMERGQILSGTPGSSDFELCLGQVYTVRDTENGTGRPVTLKVVRNESGSTLVNNQPVKWTSTEYGISIAGHCDIGDPMFAGFIDDAYATQGVSIIANAVFFIVVDGPCDRYGDTNQGYAPVPKVLLDRGLVQGEFDQFNNYLASAKWAITTDAGGSQAIQDTVGGVLLITNDVTDEDETILASPGAQFLFAQGKTIYFGAKIRVPEVATDKANVLVGVVSGAVASAISDAGAGPPASYSGACFFKVDSGTVWQAETSIAGTQNTDTDCGTRLTATYQTLNAVIYTTSATSATAKFYIDNSLVHTSTFTYTGAAQMRFMVGVHNGSGAAETMYIDYAYCFQVI